MTRRGWLLFAAMSLLWGIPYLLIKVAVGELSPPMIVLIRAGIGAMILLPVAAARGQLAPLRAHWRALLAFTALEIAGPWLLLTDAERSVSSSLAGLLVATVPLVAAVASLTLSDGDRLDRTRATGLGVGLLGVALLLGLDLGGNIRAGMEIAVVVVGYGTAPLIVSRALSGVPSLAVIASSLGLAAVVYAPVAAFSWPSHLPSRQVLWSVTGLALACTVAAFLVFFALIAEAGPNRALVITFVNPAVALLLGILILGERLTPGAVVGFPLVLVGCVLATRRTRTRQPVPIGPDAQAPGH